MRVIAGMAKGRPLKSVESRSVRPTSDKVKGAIFSMLEAEAFKRGLAEPGYLAEAGEGETVFPWRTVLDLYAGSGALGIEALSRGAERADFVEGDSGARQAIAENLRRTGLAGRGRIHGMRVETAISTIDHPYDLILLDPPYDEPDFESLFERMCESKIVGGSSFVVLEHSARREQPSTCGSLARLKTRVHGGTAISIYAAAEGD